MNILKMRKVKVLDVLNWKSCTDLLGEPTTMAKDLLKDNPLMIGDRVLFDLRILVEREEISE